MTAFVAFNMQDSGQYPISIKASGKFAVVGINMRRKCKSYTDSDAVKMHESQCLISVLI